MVATFFIRLASIVGALALGLLVPLSILVVVVGVQQKGVIALVGLLALALVVAGVAFVFRTRRRHAAEALLP